MRGLQSASTLVSAKLYIKLWFRNKTVLITGRIFCGITQMLHLALDLAAIFCTSVHSATVKAAQPSLGGLLQPCFTHHTSTLFHALMLTTMLSFTLSQTTAHRFTTCCKHRYTCCTVLSGPRHDQCSPKTRSATRPGFQSQVKADGTSQASPAWTSSNILQTMLV
jgi:hypothetical protein